jgi:hypothetical protein
LLVPQPQPWNRSGTPQSRKSYVHVLLILYNRNSLSSVEFNVYSLITLVTILNEQLSSLNIYIESWIYACRFFKIKTSTHMSIRTRHFYGTFFITF